MSRAEAEVSVTYFVDVRDKQGHPRWVVGATFVGETSEARCIEYRVRVVPSAERPRDAELLAQATRQQMQEDANRPDLRESWYLAELDPPPEGIPLRVFEEASQARLLAELWSLVKANPNVVSNEARQMLERSSSPRRGRPPVRPPLEKLIILSAVEAAYSQGNDQTLEDVAKAHNMSRSALRDLVSWARRERPPLFTSAGPGRRGGSMTPAARELLGQLRAGRRG